MLQNRRHHLLPPLGVAPLGSSVRPPVWRSAARLDRLELGAVPQHGVHDDGEAARQRDPRLAHGGSIGNRQRPGFELERAFVARQHDVRGFVKECAHLPIAAF